MIGKIIGFTVSKDVPEKLYNYQFIKDNYECLLLRQGGFYIFVWGFGVLSDHISSEGFNLAFPSSDSLYDRNVLVRFTGTSVTIENDWLGSIPVFYNSSDSIVSTNSLMTLGKHFEISNEGIVDYFDFGFSVLEQTFVRNVKFLRYFSRITLDSEGISVSYKEDPVRVRMSELNVASDEKEVLESIRKYLQVVVSSNNHTIIVPTSGGYDSRLINAMIEPKDRVRAFTYGQSKPQSDSYEVTNAKHVSRVLGISWEQIHLDHFYDYMEEWFSIFGFSTHLHGMYHIEFYRKIREEVGDKCMFLSGIIGDAWAGRVSIPQIRNADDLPKLGYTHGAVLPKRVQAVKSSMLSRKSFLSENGDIIKDSKVAVIFAMRFKLILLSYLTALPEYFGWPVATPFLNMDIVFSMLRLPSNRRNKRAWQNDFFSKLGISDGDFLEKGDKSNLLDHEAMKNCISRKSFKPISVNRMGNYVKGSHISEVNKKMSKLPSRLQEFRSILAAKHRYLRGGLKLLRIPYDSHLRYRVSYLIMRSVEKTFDIAGDHGGS